MAGNNDNRIYNWWFFEKSGLPRDVVPTSSQIKDAIKRGVTFIEELINQYEGRPARIVLYHHDPRDETLTKFQDPNSDHFISIEPDFRIIVGATHPEVGLIAVVASTDNPHYQVCYILEERVTSK